MNPPTSVSTQPAPNTSLSLPKTTTTALQVSTRAESSHPSTATYPPTKVRLRRPIVGLNDISVLIWIGLRLAPVAILIVIGCVALLGFSFALTASTGAIALLTGNGILRAAHLAHYTSNASAAYIGAVGCLISTFILAIFTSFVPKTYNKEGKEIVPWYVQLCTHLLLSTLSGTIGCAVLLHLHVDLGGIDVLHATRAGALGGAILGPGSIFVVPWVISAVMFLIFSPAWLAISMGAQWVVIRSSETRTYGSHSHSYCYCYGTRGDDPEINAELENLPRPSFSIF
ncbi:hypothetical protein BYT27DRAFT_7333860 [Phlegmacium glaucopus]|nr:hypothetical protein BYT27DRAFT_7333860 [Phlegmacium glaucopus]